MALAVTEKERTCDWNLYWIVA